MLIEPEEKKDDSKPKGKRSAPRCKPVEEHTMDILAFIALTIIGFTSCA
jgi:hypothetical protein